VDAVELAMGAEVTRESSLLMEAVADASVALSDARDPLTLTVSFAKEADEADRPVELAPIADAEAETETLALSVRVLEPTEDNTVLKIPESADDRPVLSAILAVTTPDDDTFVAAIATHA